MHSFLLSCGLLNYYNILLKQGIYEIDKIIYGVQKGELTLSYKDMEELGIKKPGHIFRFLLKVQVDAGVIDRKISDYILPNKNYNSDYLRTSDVLLEQNANCCGCT